MTHPHTLERVTADHWIEHRRGDREVLGLGYLADRHLHEGRPVRIGEVSTSGVTVIADQFGAASAETLVPA